MIVEAPRALRMKSFSRTTPPLPQWLIGTRSLKDHDRCLQWVLAACRQEVTAGNQNQTRAR